MKVFTEAFHTLDTKSTEEMISSLLRITLKGRIQGEKVVEDQEQCSWIGY